MAELKDWLQQQLDEHLVEPNSSLGQAIGYMQKHWEPLTLFLRQGGAPLDNNLCERALKKAILHRKNAYYYKTENGARIGDMFMGLIHTCEPQRHKSIRLPHSTPATCVICSPMLRKLAALELSADVNPTSRRQNLSPLEKFQVFSRLPKRHKLTVTKEALAEVLIDAVPLP